MGGTPGTRTRRKTVDGREIRSILVSLWSMVIKQAEKPGGAMHEESNKQWYTPVIVMLSPCISN